MAQDVLQDVGFLGLGSRLKRLAERLQADAGKAHGDAGFPMKPSQFPLLVALEQGALTVGEAVAATGVSQPAITRTLGTLIASDVVETRRDPDDQRVKRIHLTDAGRDLVARMRRDLWPHVHAAAAELVDDEPRTFLKHLAHIEAALEQRPLGERIERRRKRSTGLRIVPWREELAPVFAEITRAWVEEMFSLEENDRRLIENPRQQIIDQGGAIWFVEANDLGIVGTCALMPVEAKTFELTKMGVLSSARGRGAGAYLLRETLAHAERMRSEGTLEDLFLLTNRGCEAAIHLYERHGFEHDETIAASFGARYQRCDVAMIYRGWSTTPDISHDGHR